MKNGSGDLMALKEDPGSEQVNVYPNPVNNIVTIRGSRLSLKGMMITDINGKVFRNQESRQISPDSVELNLAGLNAGVYLVKIRGKYGLNVLRVIKI